MNMKRASSDTEQLVFTPDGFLCSVNLQNCTCACLQHQYPSKQCSQQLVSFWMASDRCWQTQQNFIHSWHYAYLLNCEHTENNEHLWIFSNTFIDFINVDLIVW